MGWRLPEAITCVILDPHSRDIDEPQYWWPCSSKIVIAWQSVAQIMHLSISDLSSPFFLPSLLVTPPKLSDWYICEERSKLQYLMPHKIQIRYQWLAQVPKYAYQVWYLKAGELRLPAALNKDVNLFTITVGVIKMVTNGGTCKRITSQAERNVAANQLGLADSIP